MGSAWRVPLPPALHLPPLHHSVPPSPRPPPPAPLDLPPHPPLWPPPPPLRLCICWRSSTRSLRGPRPGWRPTPPSSPSSAQSQRAHAPRPRSLPRWRRRRRRPSRRPRPGRLAELRCAALPWPALAAGRPGGLRWARDVRGRGPRCCRLCRCVCSTGCSARGLPLPGPPALVEEAWAGAALP